MTDAALRSRLARIASRPPQEWERQVAREFPEDAALRLQALMWLHADRELEHDDGRPPSLGDEGDARYELTVRIDAGATASVWQALDRRLGRAVAVKVFHEDDESEAMEQVLAEARAASDVISDHVVRVLDVQHGDRRPYIVMELVSEWDETRGELVPGATAAATRPRDVDEVARWVMQVARGVHDAHMRNVFHRDLKPRNVLVTPISRRARVADFGLAVCASTSDTVTPALTLLRRGPDGPVTVRGAVARWSLRLVLAVGHPARPSSRGARRRVATPQRRSTMMPEAPELNERSVSPAARASVSVVPPSVTTMRVASASESSCAVGTGPGRRGPLTITT